MARQTNFDHLQAMEPNQLACAILSIADNSCELCSKENCTENCAEGITAWLLNPFCPADPAWKER